MLLEQPYIGCRYKSFCNSTRLLHFCPTITSIFFCYYQTLEIKYLKKHEITVTVRSVIMMVISYAFQMGQYRDDDHREDAPHFSKNKNLPFPVL